MSVFRGIVHKTGRGFLRRIPGAQGRGQDDGLFQVDFRVLEVDFQQIQIVDGRASQVGSAEGSAGQVGPVEAALR